MYAVSCAIRFLADDVALQRALKKLCCNNVYHGFEAAANSEHGVFWMQALRAKYEGNSTQLNRAFFDRFLGAYEVSASPEPSTIIVTG